MSDKVPLVLWSGGLDSTFLMWRLLQESDVDFVVINGGQRQRKIEAEATAREKALEYFSKYAPFKAKQLNSKLHMNLASIPDVMWPQPVPWLLGALGAVHHERHSNVQVGYVLGDEILASQGYLQQTWRGMQGLSKLNAVPLLLPLTMTPKIRILSMMPVGLYDCIWYCEDPTIEGVACDECNPCTEHLTQLHKLKLCKRTIGMHEHDRRQIITPLHRPVEELV